MDITIQTNGRTRNEPGTNPERTRNEPGTNLTYTAKEVAAMLGTSDANIRLKWYPKLLEAYHWLSESDFKARDGRFNRWATEKFRELQSAISPKIPQRDLNDNILRSASGKPLMVTNPDRIGWGAYANRVASQMIPAEEEVAGELVAIEGEEIAGELVEAQESALVAIDEIGDSITDALAVIDGAGAQVGHAIAARFASSLAKSTSEGVAAAMGAVAGSIGQAAIPQPQPKRRSRTKKEK